MSIKASMKKRRRILENIKIKHYVLFVWFFVTILYGLEIWAFNINIDAGRKFAELEARQKDLVMDNIILENKIASASALRHISIKAKELGFGQPEKVMYIK